MVDGMRDIEVKREMAGDSSGWKEMGGIGNKKYISGVSH